MYEWRKMTSDQRRQVMASRMKAGAPWHSPPHWNFESERQYLISAACYEHAPVVGTTPERMAECKQQVLEVCRQHSTEIYAWCILPDHYHVLAKTAAIKQLRQELGRFHGRSSCCWNKEDGLQGRHVWHNCFDRPMKSEAHFYASMNYVHHNPVKHGYVERWQDWPFSSAEAFLEAVGREKAEGIWRKHPILDYGKTWDF